VDLIVMWQWGCMAVSLFMNAEGSSELPCLIVLQFSNTFFFSHPSSVFTQASPGDRQSFLRLRGF
jgi:hypothetical protein